MLKMRFKQRKSGRSGACPAFSGRAAPLLWSVTSMPTLKGRLTIPLTVLPGARKTIMPQNWHCVGCFGGGKPDVI